MPLRFGIKNQVQRRRGSMRVIGGRYELPPDEQRRTRVIGLIVVFSTAALFLIALLISEAYKVRP